MGVSAPTVVTFWIEANEKIWWLKELNLTPHQFTAGGVRYQPETWSGRPRMRVAWVNRGDKLAEYHTPSPHRSALCPEVSIPSLWELTYAEACGMADDYASGARGAERDTAMVLERQAESTLVRDILEQEENRLSMVRNKSSFGALSRVQRDGFPDILKRQVDKGG